MIRHQAIDRLNRLAELLDRARASVRADVRGLLALLDEASQLLSTVGTTIQEAAALGLPDPSLIAAANRARASHAALHRVLREQLASIDRQIAQADTSAEAAVRYTIPSATGNRLDRFG